MLRGVLEAQAENNFNELIYARADWERVGPAAAIEAFVYCGEDDSRARRAWRAFLAAFPSRDAAAVPLLRVRAIPRRWSIFAVDWFEDVSAT